MLAKDYLPHDLRTIAHFVPLLSCFMRTDGDEFRMNRPWFLQSSRLCLKFVRRRFVRVGVLLA
jgi:hypothetical protein